MVHEGRDPTNMGGWNRPYRHAGYGRPHGGNTARLATLISRP